MLLLARISSCSASGSHRKSSLKSASGSHRKSSLKSASGSAEFKPVDSKGLFRGYQNGDGEGDGDGDGDDDDDEEAGFDDEKRRVHTGPNPLHNR